MAWPGYFVFDDVEIINVARTEAYAAHAGLGFFRPVYRSETLALVLGDNYASPFQDAAPWTDPDHGESYQFYGVYPLDVTGIDDSTATGTVTESARNGGNVQVRRATRSLGFSAVLIGENDCALEYGLRWLRIVLNCTGCPGQHEKSEALCGGSDLEFLVCEPVLDFTFSSTTIPVERLVVDGGTSAAPGPEPVRGGSPTASGTTIIDGGSPAEFSEVATQPPTFDFTECLPTYQRYFRATTVTSGPTVTSKTTTSSGQAVWQIEWTAVAGDPAEYGVSHPLVEGFLDPDVPDPYVGGAPSGGIWDEAGFVTTDDVCPQVAYVPVFDPTCPMLIPPPPVPSIQVGCVDFPANFRRRSFTVPQQEIHLWSGVVPVLTMHTPDVDVRNVRVRFYFDADTDQDIDDPCKFIGTVIFTYLPADSTVTFDGVSQVVYVDTPGFGRRRGDSVAYGPGGAPIQWPELSCGIAYVVTVDMPQTQAPPSVDLALVGKVV